VTAPTLTLSHFQVRPLLLAREQGQAAAATSPDLGCTRVEVAILEPGAHFPNGVLLPWELAATIAGEPSKCFAVTAAAIEELRVFSPTTGWVRSLYPTATAPTTIVAGFNMHRMTDIDPLQDTTNKVKGALPLRGAVLDTATGLGYTAILAAKTATRVVTVEVDPAALELARSNPWSAPLFAATNIESYVADVGEFVAQCADAAFACVVHDPPTLKLAGELYSLAFYRQLLRVLEARGRLSHYVGDPRSTTGQRTTRGVIERLTAAGFVRVRSDPATHCVSASRP
jgi:uncharacterized protein